MLFGRLANTIGTKGALATALAGWCVVIALAIGFAPLEPTSHDDFDYRLKATGSGRYAVAAQPDLSEDRREDREWKEAYGPLFEAGTLTPPQAKDLVEAVRRSELSRFGISVEGGPPRRPDRGRPVPPVGARRADRLVAPHTPPEPVGAPLGLAVDFQWLAMGVLVGMVLGGSQALARSLFAYMTPESRSAEFFGFFGFVGRASAVFGPTLYLLFTGIYDTRVAILVILVIIVVGTTMLRWIDVAEGRAMATEQDRLASY